MEKNILSMKLKNYRQQKGITQQELAELLNVSDKSISKWEVGNGYPSKKNMLKISELLGISLEVLLLEEKDEEQNKFKLSIKYGLISYVILFALTIAILGWKETEQYKDILTWEVTEILKLAAITFTQNTVIAFVPSVIIGLTFYFYIIPKQQTD